VDRRSALQKDMKIIRKLKVVNDASERGIAEVIIFDLSLTRRESERQFLSRWKCITHNLPHPRESGVYKYFSGAGKVFSNTSQASPVPEKCI